MSARSVKSALKKNPADYFLPDTVVPKHYAITMMVDRHETKFSGEETITIEVLEPVSAIKINVGKLRISRAQLVDDQNKCLAKGKVALNRETKIATIDFGQTIVKGTHKLCLKFSGYMGKKLLGFYRSSWIDAKKHKRLVLLTQLETSFAREVFPCFDEPRFKATFGIKLIVDRDFIARSNSDNVKETNLVVTVSGKRRLKKLVEFADTAMPLTTYVVVFVIGNLVSSKVKKVGDVEIRVWAAPDVNEKQTELALDAACAATAFYIRYNERPYPGKKIDEVAVKDFAAGAMENWGCITYRETALLCDLLTATFGEIFRVVFVVSHEHAHFVFGDEVSPLTWTDLWLNESNADFMAFLAVDDYKPEWKVWDIYAIDRAAAMLLDSLHTTHPIQRPVIFPEDADEMFDLISYQKGCGVLYQMQQFIGPEIFRQGNVIYVRKHANGNAAAHDYWDGLEESCRVNKLDVPVGRIMDSWIHIAGHPVITVIPGQKPGVINLKQRPFKFLEKPGVDIDPVWPIPVVFRIKRPSGEVEVKKVLFDQKEQSFDIGEYVWVNANGNGSGFYRVQYHHDLMFKLLAVLQTELTVVERLNLINDSWSFLLANQIKLPEYLSLLSCVGSEMDPNVWSIIIQSLTRLYSLASIPGRQQVEQLVRSLAQPVLKQIKYTPQKNEDIHIRRLRGLLLGALGTIGKDTLARSLAGAFYKQYKQSKTSIDCEVLDAVIAIIANRGNLDVYNELFEMYTKATTPQEARRFFMALAKFQDPELLQTTLDHCLDGKIRTQDAPRVVAAVLRNQAGGMLAWSFIKKNWAKMNRSYPSNQLVNMCEATAEIGTTDPKILSKLAKDIKQFFGKKEPPASGKMAIAETLETLGVNLRLHNNLMALAGPKDN